MSAAAGTAARQADAVAGGDGSTSPARSAITAVAPRWDNLPCSQCASVRTTHSATRIQIWPAQCATVRVPGSVMTPATICASTTADAIVVPLMTTPQATDAARKRRIAGEACKRFSSTASPVRWMRVSRRR
jgi:hypothetical protein